MKTDLKPLSGSIILFLFSVLCIFSVPAWSCLPPPVPVAVLRISPDPALVGQAVLLDGSGSFTSRSYINRYEWDFDKDEASSGYETVYSHDKKAFWSGVNEAKSNAQNVEKKM